MATDSKGSESYLGGVQIPFELSIGVTGHRDLEDPDGVSALVRDRLETIHRRFQVGRVTPVRVIVYSGLAEGADRIVIKEALRVFPRDGLEIRAILPLTPEEYERDFEDPASREEFRELLAKAVPSSVAAVADRDEAYELAGREVVDRSDVLIAIWDGRSSDRRGGTAATVDYARSDSQVSTLIVPAARVSEPAGPGVPATPMRKALGSRLARSALNALTATERLNRLNLDAVSRPLEESRKLEIAIADPVTRSIYETAAAWSLPLYARADALAVRFQRRHERLSTSLFLLAALAVTAVAAQLETGVSDLFALVEVGFMVTALAVYAAAIKLDAHDRWLGYRSLAEEFRAGLFLVMTGVEGRERSPSPEDNWHQRVFSAAWQLRPMVDLDDRAAPGVQSFLLDGWIAGQIEYHQKKQARLHREREWLRDAVLGLFGLTVVAGLTHAFEPLAGAGWRKAAIFMAIALPGWGAALTGIRDQRQQQRHEGRSERTLARLKRLRDEAPTPATAATVRKLAGEARKIAADDSAEWSGVEEFQDLELPV